MDIIANFHMPQAWYLFLVPAALLLAGAFYYNRLVALRNLLSEAWSGVDVLLKMRHDLVPNLVETVKAYTQHEQSTLNETIQARNATLPVHGTREVAEAEANLNSKLVHVLALAESYPQLKADQLFRQLMADLVKIEDDLQYSRRYFNGTVRDLNNMVESFPSNLVARLFGFEVKDFFELERISDRQLSHVNLSS